MGRHIYASPMECMGSLSKLKRDIQKYLDPPPVQHVDLFCL